MTPTEVTEVLHQFNEWQRGHNTVLRPSSSELGEAIDAAVEMIERSVKLEQALKAMTKTYKSVPYAQWPAEMHFANEVLEKSK